MSKLTQHKNTKESLQEKKKIVIFQCVKTHLRPECVRRVVSELLEDRVHHQAAGVVLAVGQPLHPLLLLLVHQGEAEAVLGVAEGRALLERRRLLSLSMSVRLLQLFSCFPK